VTVLVDESEVDRRLASSALADTPQTEAVRVLRTTRNGVPGQLRLQAERIRFGCILIALELLGDRALWPRVVPFCRPIGHMLQGESDWLVTEFQNPDLPSSASTSNSVRCSGRTAPEGPCLAVRRTHAG